MFENVTRAILEGDDEGVEKLIASALADGADPLELINKGCLPGIEKAGDLFEAEEIYLPELILAGEAMKKAMSILEPVLKERDLKSEKLGKYIIGTVEGDMHDIGKNIVASLLTASGFEVVDLGLNVSTESFVEAVKKESPDILGLSALLTTTMAKQKDVIEVLIEEGLRDSLKVMVGGAPVTANWAEKIGADAYAEDAIESVRVAKSLAQKS